MIDILYNDDNFVVCIKPYGVISQYDNARENMVSILAKQLSCEIFPVHRLDRTTAGVMVFAKTKSAAADFAKQISNGDFKKEYLAVVHKKCDQNGELVDLLYFDKAKNKSYVVKKERNGVKKAILNFLLLESYSLPDDDYSLVKVKLVTGRTHQIRVQFASRGMPLAGDRRYGAKDSFKNIALWSTQIEFINPADNQPLSFSSQPNNEFFSI